MANELPGAHAGNPPVTLLCAATGVADSCVVTYSSTGLAVAADTSKNVIGVTLGAVAGGEYGNVALTGSICSMTAGAAITAGDPLTCTTAGKVIKQTTSAPTIGYAIEGASGDGVKFRGLFVIGLVSNA